MRNEDTINWIHFVLGANKPGSCSSFLRFILGHGGVKEMKNCFHTNYTKKCQTCVCAGLLAGVRVFSVKLKEVLLSSCGDTTQVKELSLQLSSFVTFSFDPICRGVVCVCFLFVERNLQRNLLRNFSGAKR